AKETSYITMAIAGAFLVGVGAVELVRRRRGQGPGPLSSALASTRSRGWLTAVTVFVVLYATLFTTFFTNPAGISGIVDGITYWAGQQSAARLAGYIPPYFYLLL